MKVIHKLSLALAGALLLAAALVVPLATASQAQPEITDVKGDAASGKDSRDLTSAFFDKETNDTFMVNLTLTSLETYTNPNEIPNAPTTEYEVYFSVGDSNYAVACKVPVHGPLGFTIQFDVRSVSYGNNTTTESSLATLSSCRYDVTGHSIQWLVPKTHFSNLTAGAHLTKTWAAVYNKNFGDSLRRIEDRGPNSGYGRDYVVRGATGAEIIRVVLTVDNQTQPCKPNEPAVFKISVFNDGTSQVSVDLFNSTPDKKGWTVELSLTNLTIPINVTRTVSVIVTCPRDAANRTSLTISVYGKVTTPANQTGQTNNTLLLTSTVNYVPPKPVEDNFLVKMLKFFTKPTLMTYLLIALIVVAIAGGAASVAVRRMRRMRTEEQVPAMPAPLPAK